MPMNSCQEIQLIEKRLDQLVQELQKAKVEANHLRSELKERKAKSLLSDELIISLESKVKKHKMRVK